MKPLAGGLVSQKILRSFWEARGGLGIEKASQGDRTAKVFLFPTPLSFGDVDAGTEFAER